MVKVGREEPAVSMDASGGKIIWARHSEVQQANLKAMGEGTEIKETFALLESLRHMLCV
jgi:coatomer subunit beta'